MQTTRITRLYLLLTAAAIAACAGSPSRQPANSEGATRVDAAPQLSIPDHALDALPLEHLLAAEFALREDDLDAAAQAYLEAARESDAVEVARRATRVNLAAQRWQDAATALARWRELGGAQAPDFRQAEALLALGQGDADTATSLLLGLLQTGGMPATRLAAGALEAAPDRALALNVFERLAAAPTLPDDRAVLIGLSQLALKFERKDLAEALAVRASERLPDAPEVWFWRARLANAAGNSEEARRVLKQAVALNPNNPDIRRTYAVLLKNELGDAKAAAQVLAEMPPDDETLTLRAAYAIEAEDWPQVAAVQQALTALPQPRPAARLMLLGGVAEALAEQIEQTAPGSAEIARRREEAARWYRDVPSEAEEYPRALQRMAVLDQQAGRVDAALARLAELREIADSGSEDYADSFLLEAELLDRAGRENEALAALDAGLAALPDEQRLRYSRGLLRERVGRVDEALEDFRVLVETDPDNAAYLNAYGYTLTDRTDRHDEALVLIERALAMNPEDIATTDSMGWVLYKLGRHDEALVHLRRAHAAQPDGEIAAHLGEVLWVKGEREEARKLWRAAVEADPDNRALKAVLARFKPW